MTCTLKQKLLAPFILILLSACQISTPQPKTPEQTAFVYGAQYQALTEEVIKYLAKPTCTGIVVVNCRKAELVKPLQEATSEASVVVTETAKLARDGLAYDKQRVSEVLATIAEILAKG
jgi:hypothetical protein